MIFQRGISFGEIHSFYDLGLILSEVDIPAAKPKTRYIDIPGGDGSLDLSEVHGDIKYSDRDCKFTFTAARPMSGSEWEEHKTIVSNALNGKAFRITLDKDPDYYYTGRCEIDDFSVNKRIRQIVVKAKVNPWKWKQNVTVNEFELSNFTQEIELVNARKKVCPVIECTNDNTNIVWKNTYYMLNAGTHKLLNIQLSEGSNVLGVAGSGTITFTWQEADL